MRASRRVRLLALVPVAVAALLALAGVGVDFHDVGRLVRDLATGEVIFEAGPHDVLHGDYVALFCAALGV